MSIYVGNVEIDEKTLSDFQEIWNKNKGNGLSVYLKNHPEVDDCLCKILEQEHWFESKRKLYSFLLKGITKPVCCAVCGTTLKASLAIEGKKCCSYKCSGRSPERLEKVKKTTLERYGVENAFQSKEIQEKQKKTCVEKYGVENVFQSEDIKDKIKQTNLERYGVEFIYQSDEIKEKLKKSNLEKYGVEYSSQRKEVREKTEKTNLEKYGSKAPAQNKQVVEKMKKTCLEKYGVDCTLKVDEIDKKRQETWNKKYGGNPSSDLTVREKRKNTNIERFGSEIYQTSPFYFKKILKTMKEKWKNYVVPMFSDEEYCGTNKGIVYKWKCVKCGNEFEQKIQTNSHTTEKYEYIPRCLNCYPFLTGISNREKEVCEFVKSIYDGEIVENDRTIISPYELDIYLPDKKLAIEFDGVYWHNSENKSENYHLFKTNECEKQGIQLIHIFEDEWINKREIVEDRIKSILGVYDRKIYARKCEIKTISSKESNQFLEENHLQGGDNSYIRYGLFFEDELISVMTFGKPRFNKNFDFELIRFACKIGTQVIGGFGKLLKHFTKNNINKSVVSYADRRYSNGNVYLKNNFSFIEISKPSYFYVRGVEKYSRYQCQKHKLKNILGDNFDEELSETENMFFNGFYKMYDCGNLVYKLN